MKIYRWPGLAALPLLVSLLATDAWAQGGTVCDWYGFAEPRLPQQIAADVVISSTTNYDIWATVNGKRVARLHFQSLCRVTAQGDQGGADTAYPVAIKLINSSSVRENTGSTITFFTLSGTQFDQVVFQPLNKPTQVTGRVTSDPYGADQTQVHVPTFTFDASGFRVVKSGAQGQQTTSPIAAEGSFGRTTQVYRLFCGADPVIANRYGYSTEYAGETGRATQLDATADPQSPSNPLYYDGGDFPEQSLLDAGRGILRRFHNVNVTLNPQQLNKKQLGSIDYYQFNLKRDNACYPRE
jgi:hypothetical protein